MENYNQKNNFETEIDEAVGNNIKNLLSGAKDFRSLSRELKLAFKDMELAIGLKNNPIKLGSKELRTADEIFTAIKDGSLAGKELGRVEKGLLKSRNTDSALRKAIAVDFAKDKNVLGELAKMNRNTTAEIKDYLKTKGYPQESINEIIAQMKANGAIDAKGLLAKNAANAGKTGGKTSKSLLTRTKELLTNIKVKKMSWKQLLVWAAGIGIGAYALWYFVKETSNVIPDGMPDTPPNQKDDWGPCLTDLMSKKQAKIAKTPKGQIVVYMPTSEKYPGGLQFYSNGRVMDVKTSEMGTWSCVGGTAQINESVGKPKINESLSQIVKRVLNERFLIEQSTSEIDNDVEDMIDYLDAPVYGNDYVNIFNLLKKYAANGKYKEFAEQYNDAGIMKSSLRSDISSIYTTDAAPTRMKKQIVALLDQIESGKVAPTASVSNQQTRTVTTTIEEQNVSQKLKIVWDKDKKQGGGDGNSGGDGSTATRKTYYDCTNVNIDTTPLTYGCKSSKIGEVQKCLGVAVDNKFGPATRKALTDNAYDMSKGITKEIYTKVLAGCKKGEAAPTTGSSDGSLTDVNYLRNPIKMDLGQVPEMPKKKTSIASDSNGMTDTQYYTSLINAGLFNATGILGRTAYNGPALEPSEKEKIDRVLGGMGYSPSKLMATDTGARYVWQKD